MTDSPRAKQARTAQAARRRTTLVILFSVAGLAIAAGGLVVTKKVFWPKIKAHQISSLNAEARDLLAQKDPVNAMLLVRKSLQKSQYNPEAWKLGAMASMQRGQPEAIYYQNQLCKQKPTGENQLEMMRIAAHFEQFGLVLNTGKETAKDNASVAEYHKLMADAYQKVGRPIAAKYHLELLCSINPGDLQAKLNLAAFELAADKERKNRTVRTQLRSLADHPDYKRKALSLLLREAVEQRQQVDALELLSRLEVSQGLELDERLLIVEATRLFKPRSSEEQIKRLLRDHASDDAQIVRVIDFLVQQSQAALVRPWFDSLPPEHQRHIETRRAVAEALFALKDWKGLAEFLQEGRWDNLEFLRHALLAYAYRSQGLITEYFENWKASVMEAGADARSCAALLQRVEKWKWESERYDVVWKLFHLFPNNEQLRNQLYAWELKTKNTPNLNRMFMRMIELDPLDAVAQSNFAYTSFLLGANIARAGLIAKNLYATNPNDPYYITLYSLYLLREGKEDEAKAMMDSLRQSALTQPERLAVYSHILARTGDFQRATDIISGIDRNNLLPEERSLIERAENEIARGTRTRELVARMGALREAAVLQADGGWMTLMQPETRATMNPSMQLANSLYMAGDLKGLGEVLRDDDWQENEYLRHALAAFCHRNSGNAVQSSEQWRAALSGARRSQGPLENLAALCSHWSWETERLQALNALLDITPYNRILLAELAEHYRARGRTADLIRILGRHLSDNAQKGHEAIAHAYYCLISGINLSQATVAARDCLDAEPDNSDARFVQALSLYRQDRCEEAERLLAETRAATSDLVSIPLIHAAVALGSGETDEAEAALASVDRSRLLPEERALLEKVQSGIRAKRKQASG